MQCQSCGSENRPTANFCNDCGKALSSDTGALQWERNENGKVSSSTIGTSPSGLGWQPGVQESPLLDTVADLALVGTAERSAEVRTDTDNHDNNWWSFRGRVRNFQHEASDSASTWRFQISPILGGEFPLGEDGQWLSAIDVVVAKEILTIFEPLPDDTEIKVKLSEGWKPDQSVTPSLMQLGNGAIIYSGPRSASIPGEVRDVQIHAETTKGMSIWEFHLFPDVDKGLKPSPIRAYIEVPSFIEPLAEGETVTVDFQELRPEWGISEANAILIGPTKREGVCQYICGSEGYLKNYYIRGEMQSLQKRSEPGTMIWSFKLFPNREARIKQSHIDVEMRVPYFSEGSSGDRVAVRFHLPWKGDEKVYAGALYNESRGTWVSETNFEHIGGEVRGLQQRIESEVKGVTTTSSSDHFGNSVQIGNSVQYHGLWDESTGRSQSLSETKAVTFTQGTAYYTFTTQVWTFRLVNTDQDGSLQSQVDVELRGSKIKGQLHDGDRVSVYYESWTPRTTLDTNFIRNATTGGAIYIEDNLDCDIDEYMEQVQVSECRDMAELWKRYRYATMMAAPPISDSKDVSNTIKTQGFYNRLTKAVRRLSLILCAVPAIALTWLLGFQGAVVAGGFFLILWLRNILADVNKQQKVELVHVFSGCFGLVLLAGISVFLYRSWDMVGVAVAGGLWLLLIGGSIHILRTKY
jgi:hypothetical protein